MQSHEQKYAVLRKNPVKLIFNTYTGYQVNNKAVREINGQKGVYVLNGNIVKFKKINIVYSDSEYSICSVPDGESGYLKQYDEIIVEGLIFMTEKSLIDEKFSDIEYNLKAIREDIAEAAIKSGRRPEDIDFMAVTKTVDEMYINHAIDCGITLIGENKVQEMLRKKPNLKLTGVRKILSDIYKQTRRLK